MDYWDWSYTTRHKKRVTQKTKKTDLQIEKKSKQDKQDEKTKQKKSSNEQVQYLISKGKKSLRFLIIWS